MKWLRRKLKPFAYWVLQDEVNLLALTDKNLNAATAVLRLATEKIEEQNKKMISNHQKIEEFVSHLPEPYLMEFVDAIAADLDAESHLNPEKMH